MKKPAPYDPRLDHPKWSRAPDRQSAFARFGGLSRSTSQAGLDLALSMAINDGDGLEAAEIMRAGASPNATCGRGIPILQKCAALGGAGALAMEALLEGGANIEADWQGFTALMRAAASSTPNAEFLVGLLLKAGANPMAGKLCAPQDGEEPWTMDASHWAARMGQPGSMARLIAARPSPPRESLWSLWMWTAIFRDNAPMVKFLLGRGPPGMAGQMERGATTLSAASREEHVETMGALLEAGADIDGRSSLGCHAGMTALMVAALASKGDAVAFLLSRGADPSLRNDQGQSALDLLAENERPMERELLSSMLEASLLRKDLSREVSPSELAQARKSRL